MAKYVRYQSIKKLWHIKRKSFRQKFIKRKHLFMRRNFAIEKIQLKNITFIFCKVYRCLDFIGFRSECILIMRIKSEYGLRWTRGAININLTVAETRDKSSPSISCAYYPPDNIASSERGMKAIPRSSGGCWMSEEELEAVLFSRSVVFPSLSVLRQ